MTKDKIYKALHSQNISASMIADAIQISHQAVCDVIAKGHGSRRVAEAVAKLLDKPLTEVFPYYMANHSQHYRANKRQLHASLLSGRMSAIA